MSGKVLLVGAGPGDPDLLTVRALRALQSANVVLHDDLIGPQILELIPPTVQVRNVGKRCGRKSTPQGEINAQLIAFASFGLSVVRLKGGDPLIFGRAGEEIEALHKANVDFEVVPGVTSALASAAAAKVSLTHRKTASAVIFLSSHHAHDRTADWKPFVASGATLAIYMPGSDYGQISSRLIAAGMKSHMPCALVSRASSNEELIHRTTIDQLRQATALPAPTLLLVGEVVGSIGASVSSIATEAWFQQTGDSAPVMPEAFVDGQSHLGQLGANL